MQIEFEFLNVLLLFFVIPLIIVVYWRYNAKNKKSVLKFSSLKIIKTSTRESIFRKHIPFALTVIILGLIIIALANPQIMIPSTEKGINLSIVLDGSESMAATDYEPTRLESAKKSIVSLVSKMSPQNNVGVVLFETGATTISYMTPIKEKQLIQLCQLTRVKELQPLGTVLY